MGHGINVRETVEDRDTWFNVKHFTIGDVSFTRPEKSLDIKPIDKQVYSLVSRTTPFKFAESSRRIPKFEHLVELYQESDENRINEMFSKRGWLDGAPCVLNFTLGFNPMTHVDQKKVFESFLDYYYSYSNFFLTVPNIRTKKWVMKTENSPSHVVEVANREDYIKSVDLFYDILSAKNKKPIFVPVSVRMSAQDLDELLNHYVKRERFDAVPQQRYFMIGQVIISSIVHLWSVVPAAMAGVLCNHFLRVPFFPLDRSGLLSLTLSES